MEKDLNEYFANLDNCDIHSLEDLVRFNNEHAAEELNASTYILPLDDDVVNNAVQARTTIRTFYREPSMPA